MLEVHMVGRDSCLLPVNLTGEAQPVASILATPCFVNEMTPYAQGLRYKNYSMN